MAVYSGIDGNVVLGSSVIASVRSWSVNTSEQSASGVASNTGGMTVRKLGAKDFTGTMSGFGRSPLGFIVPGTAYTFYGRGSTDEFKAGIMCEQVTIRCDLSGSRPLEWTANFGALGSSTAAGSDNTLFALQNKTSFSDSSSVELRSPVEDGAKASWDPLTSGAQVGETDIPDVQSWDLTLSCSLKPYVSSSTGGVTKRKAGPKDARASVNLLQSDLSTLVASATILTPGQLGILRLYVSSTLNFGLTWCISEGMNLSTQIESGELDSVAVSFGYTGYAVVSSAMTKGSIVDPNSVAWYS